MKFYGREEEQKTINYILISLDDIYEELYN